MAIRSEKMSKQEKISTFSDRIFIFGCNFLSEMIRNWIYPMDIYVRIHLLLDDYIAKRLFFSYGLVGCCGGPRLVPGDLGDKVSSRINVGSPAIC